MGPPPAVPGAPGAYVLVLRLAEPAALDLPRLGNPVLPAGRYAYCGSARGPGGLAARIARHLRAEKPQRWHIDRLTAVAPVERIYWQAGGGECALVARLRAAGATAPIPGFGSSDCRLCVAHLLTVTTARLSGLGDLDGGGWRRSGSTCSCRS